MSAPSPFFLEHADGLREASARGPVLDLACGRGRHTLANAERGVFTVGLDRSAAALRELRDAGTARQLPLATARADLETSHGIPVRPGSCGAILVFRFLFRPLARAIQEALTPGGLLLYETFTIDQRDLPYGPNNEAFLLRPGELATMFPGLRTLEAWEGHSSSERPDALARLLAHKPG